MPKVLHIHFWADIRNSAGSVEKVITAFAAHGQRYVHQIACCSPEGSDGQPFEYFGVQVFPFNESKLANRIFNKILGLKAFTYPDLIRLIHRERPDILHFHNRQELVDAVVARLKYRPRVVVHYHRHFSQPVIPQRADHLLFISKTTAADILGKVPSSLPYSVVYNPLSGELCRRFNLDRTTSANRNSPPVILFGGGGNPIKGGAELIAAFAGLPVGSAKLLLAGRNVEKLPGLPCPGSEVIGEVPAEHFFTLMQQADMVVMPSIDEGFGLVAQEAMALNRLVLVSTAGGLVEFTDASCAIVVEPRSVESLRQGLVRGLEVLAAPPLLSPMLEAARDRVNRFLPDKIGAELEAVYAAL